MRPVCSIEGILEKFNENKSRLKEQIDDLKKKKQISEIKAESLEHERRYLDFLALKRFCDFAANKPDRQKI